MYKFCSCDNKHKSTVGGVRANQPLTLFVDGCGECAHLILTKEGEGHVPVFYPMTRADGGFTVTVTITTSGLYFYHFVIDGIRYGENGMQCLTEGGKDFVQLVFEGEFRPLRGGVIYQIMPDRFCKIGDPCLQNGRIYQPDIFAVPEYMPDSGGKYNSEFFGGSIKGITSKLDYLASLGVSYIYLNPIFEAASNHRYDTGDYEKIDAMLGTDGDFDELIAEAKKRDIGIILDGVFSHTGDDSKYFNRYGRYDSLGAYQSPQSPYLDWYNFTDYPTKYKSWWGFETLPEVNETSHGFMEYMLGQGGIVDRWERRGIAGWRLDVADELPDEFMEALRRRSTLTLIGEVWENAAQKYSYGHRRSYLRGSQLDGVTNYPFKDAIIDFLCKNDNTLLRKTVNQLVNDYPCECFLSVMNVLSTHDTVRILTALSTDPVPSDKDGMAAYVQSDIAEAAERLKIASLIQYVLPGVPCLFYGDEAGLYGHADPFCRKFYPWGRENAQLIQHYRALGELRKSYASVFAGSVEELSPSNEVFVLRRSDGVTDLTLTVNLSDSDVEADGEAVFGEKTVKPFAAAVTKSVRGQK